MGKVSGKGSARFVEPVHVQAKPHILGYRMEQVRRMIDRWLEERGIPPSYNQICDETGISSRGKVSEILSRLEARGYHYREGEFKQAKGLPRGEQRRIRLA